MSPVIVLRRQNKACDSAGVGCWAADHATANSRRVDVGL